MSKRCGIKVDFLWVWELAQKERKVGLENGQISPKTIVFFCLCARLETGGKITSPTNRQWALWKWQQSIMTTFTSVHGKYSGFGEMGKDTDPILQVWGKRCSETHSSMKEALHKVRLSNAFDLCSQPVPYRVWISHFKPTGFVQRSPSLLSKSMNDQRMCLLPLPEVGVCIPLGSLRCQAQTIRFHCIHQQVVVC